MATCDNVRTTLSQPCDSFKIQGCAKVVKKHCGNLVPRLCRGCNNLVISVWVLHYRVLLRIICMNRGLICLGGGGGGGCGGVYAGI